MRYGVQPPSWQTGPLTRGGRLKIFPGTTREEQEWIENNTNTLQQIAKRVLHGRNATIFENCVIYPLIGLPKGGIKEMATQFNIPEKRVYNIIDRCKQRIMRIVRGAPEQPHKRETVKRQWVPVREYIEGKPFLFGPVREDKDGRRYIEYWIEQ